MVLCFAACCNHQTVRNKCSFYRFPKGKKLRALWTERSRRADRKPDDNSRLCSCHFVDGNKKNNPTEFSYKKNKSFSLKNLEKHTTPNPNIPVNNGDQNQPGPSGIQGPTATLSKRLNMVLLESQVTILEKENVILKEELNKNNLYFHFDHIKNKPDLVLMYTGLPNAGIFTVVLNYIERFPFKYYLGWVVQMPLEDQLFITLQKLRLNYNFQDLAVRYSVSVTTIRNIFFTLVHVIHESMYKFIYGDNDNIPSVQKIMETSPIESSFPNCRFLLDCTEVTIETPRMDMDKQKQSYSSYKKGQTAKALIAVAPNGKICYCSKLFPGSFSDKAIVEKSGFLEVLKPGDLIIADKGFLIRDILPKGVMLNLPPFLLNPQFSEEEVKYTTKIARARIHVERSIQRIKSFLILHKCSHNFTPILTKIFQVCVLLINLQTPVLSDSNQSETSSAPSADASTDSSQTVRNLLDTSDS